MSLPPEIEQDLRDLEKKLTKRRQRRKIVKRMGGGAALLWVALVVGALGDMIPAKSLAYALVLVVAITLVFCAIGLAAWGFITLMETDGNHEL